MASLAKRVYELPLCTWAGGSSGRGGSGGSGRERHCHRRRRR